MFPYVLSWQQNSKQTESNTSNDGYFYLTEGIFDIF